MIKRNKMATIEEEWDDFGYLQSIVIKETGKRVSFTTAKALEQYIEKNKLERDEYDIIFIDHLYIPFNPENTK